MSLLEEVNLKGGGPGLERKALFLFLSLKEIVKI